MFSFLWWDNKVILNPESWILNLFQTWQCRPSLPRTHACRSSWRWFEPRRTGGAAASSPWCRSLPPSCALNTSCFFEGSLFVSSSLILFLLLLLSFPVCTVFFFITIFFIIIVLFFIITIFFIGFFLSVTSSSLSSSSSSSLMCALVVL